MNEEREASGSPVPASLDDLKRCPQCKSADIMPWPMGAQRVYRCCQCQHRFLTPFVHSQQGAGSPVPAEAPRCWQLIETAPKDGTPVRLKWEGTTVEAIGRWCPAESWPKPFSTNDWRDVKGDDVLLMPTHWRPAVPAEDVIRRLVEHFRTRAADCELAGEKYAGYRNAAAAWATAADELEALIDAPKPR